MISITNKEVFDVLLGKYSSEIEGDFLAECFSNDESSEKFEQFRENLIENYLSGKLSPDDNLKFVNHFLANPHHFELFEFSRNVRGNLKADAELKKVINAKKSYSFGNLLIPVGGLAAILVGFAVVWQFVLKNNYNQTAQTNPDQTNSASNSKSPFSTTDEANSNTKFQVENNIIGFSLPTMAKGFKNSELKITNQTKEVNLLALLPVNDFSQYQIRLEQDNKILWQKDFENLVSNQNGQISITVSAEKFQTGEHRFIIFGKNKAGKFEEMKDSERFFTVSK